MDPATLGIGLMTNFIQQDMAARRARREQFLAQQEANRMHDASKFQADSVFLQSYPTSGVAQTSFAKYGGWVKKLKKKSMSLGGYTMPDYIAEDQEVVDFGPGKTPQAGRFGKLNRLSSSSVKIEGDSHDDPSGGVEMTGGERVFSDRLYASNLFTSKLRKL